MTAEEKSIVMQSLFSIQVLNTSAMEADDPSGFLVAMDAQIESLAGTIDGFKEGAEDSKACTHPPKYRRSRSTLGGPEKWVCELCGYEYNEKEQNPHD